MARVTVEDCVEVIPNRFELSLIAGNRAKALMEGAPQIIESKKKEKETVVALREIGDNLLDVNTVRENMKKEIRDLVQIKETSKKTLSDLENAKKPAADMESIASSMNQAQTEESQDEAEKEDLEPETNEKEVEEKEEK